MSDCPVGTLTTVLKAVQQGTPGAVHELVHLIYEELRSLAKRQRNQSPARGLLQTTELVHEAYLKLFRQTEPTWENRRHFFWGAARAMHDVLVEEARRCKAKKRGGDRKRIEMTDDLAVWRESQQLLYLSEAIGRLKEASTDLADVVMLHFFGGLSHDECAQILDLSVSTVRRRWSLARAWLRRELKEADVGDLTST